MRKWSVILLAVLLMGWLFYAIIFNWLVPKTASFGVPARWGRLPLRQPKEIVHGYLGNPAVTSGNREEWTGGTTKKMYRLQIYYHTDTVASSYSVYYFYRSRLVNRSYLVDSGSIR